jgi:hypothetical protein
VIGVQGTRKCSSKLGDVASMFDLSLLLSGTKFNTGELVELARWGHFSNAHLPWECENKL